MTSISPILLYITDTGVYVFSSSLGIFSSVVLTVPFFSVIVVAILNNCAVLTV
jgi:hypothetical protein